MPDQEKGENQESDPEGTRKSPDNSTSESLADNKKPQRISHKSKKKCRITGYGFRCIGLIVEILVFFAVAVYGFFSYQQWQAMRQQLTLNERAWVAIAGVEGFPEVDKPLKVTVKFTNTGKT